MKITCVLLVLSCTFSAHAGVSAWIPFDSTAGHISIPVTLNGEETRAILDSGATGNGISERFLERHEGEYTTGGKITLSGLTGTRTVRVVNDIEINMFGADIKMNELWPTRMARADLIIGLGFFQNFILQIDYPNSRLRILTHDVMDLKKFANVKMKKSGGSLQPMVRVTLNNEHKVWLMLDTGNSTGIYMPRSIAVHLGWLEEFGTADVRIAGINSVSDNLSFNLPEISMGPYTLENVVMVVPAKGQKTNVGKKRSTRVGSRLNKSTSEGILGYDVLKHFIVTIDFKRTLLHLEPPPE